MTSPDSRANNLAHRKDYSLWWLVAIGLIGVVVYLARSYEVFPSASIDLTISPKEILSQSKKWAQRLGYKQPYTVQSTIFSFDNEAKTFLEYELGLTEANKLMKDQVPVWYWSTRLCRPLSPEEFAIEISPQGRLVSFEHSLENDRTLPGMAHEEARKLALDFLQQKAGLVLKEYKLVEDGSVSQSHRTDHYFTWEDSSVQFKGAKLRVYAYIAGNMLTKFNYFLYVPETWLRKFSQLRSYNAALEEVASIFYVAFNTATFFAFIWAFTSGRLRWRFALVVSGLVAIMDLAESLNSLPNAIHNYDTTMSYRAYLVDVYVGAVWGSLSQWLRTFILVGAAESLYRVAHPTKIALEQIASKVGLRSRQLITGLIAGHAMFGIHLGWVVLYYLYGRNLGVWSPLEVRTTEGLSSVVPFYSSMYVGATAAIFEELTYRVLGLTIFQRLFKHFWLANLLQATAWAFMHSNYPQEPPWARGVELTVVGVFYGGVIKRYGLVPCIISHYVFDTFLGVVPLIDSSLLSLKLPSVLAVSPFLVVLAVALWLRKLPCAIAQEQSLQNSQLELVRHSDEVEEMFPHTPYSYVSLSKQVRMLLALAAVVGILIAFGSFSPLVGQDSQLSISRTQAIAAARRCLHQQGIATAGRYEVAWLSRGLDLEALQYV
ncbi:MAG: CPBP family intramembrane metalloprotease, partial [Candidatus Melainabacteria bacterium]|nr:CPBP family intramembrane metalloprotease [Candidatus Melainabacteria bacterium]